MGWWGSGNFEGDAPRDYLADVIGNFEKVVECVLAGEQPRGITSIDFAPGLSDAGEGCLVPTLAIIIALHEALNSDYLPNAETIERWKQRYLEMFDKPNLDFDVAEHKAKRRQVIVATFDKLLQLSCRQSTTVREA
jgi:hypothetical protein